MLATAAGVAAAVRRLASGPAPAAAALLCLAFAATLFRGYVAIDDPQWLAHALMTAGFALLIPRAGQAPPASATVGAALLMLAGGLVKHNLVALPLAATLWLVWHHRRSAAVWMATGAAGLAVAAALCFEAYGTAIFANLFGAARHYSWARVAVKSAGVLAASLPLLVAAWPLWRERRRDTRIDLLILAVVIGVPLGVIERSGQGVNYNAHFEGLIALCIAAGVALARSRWPGRTLAWWAVPFVVLVPVAVTAEASAFAGRAAARRDWQAIETRIAATPGRGACEIAALCFQAGKAFEVDFFLYGQRVALGGDPSAFVRALDERRFAVIELEPDRPPRVGEVADPLRALIRARYRLAFAGADGRQLYVPLSAAAPTR